jgi:hypothetical protein
MQRVKGYRQFRGNKSVKVKSFSRKERKPSHKIKKQHEYKVTYFIDGNGQLVSKRIYKRL